MVHTPYILGALGLWHHLEYEINACLEHWWYFSEPGSLALPYCPPLPNCPAPEGPSPSQTVVEQRLEVSWTSCRERLEVGCLSSGPRTIISLGQRLSPLWPTDQTPCCPSVLAQITAQASTLFPQSTVTLDGGKLVHVQKWDGQETTLVRELTDGKLILVRQTTLEPCLASYYCCPFSQACCEESRFSPGSTESWDHGGWRTGRGGVGWEFYV